MMLPKGVKQEQTGGEGGKNYQAGGDIVIHADLEEMRAVALSVYKENALELRGIAEDIAYARADRLTTEFLGKLNENNPQSVGSLADPDMQSVLFDAQTQYARSGEEDLGQVLVDLLADRASQETRTLRTLALNEAIHSAPKLTEQQRRAIGLVFILRYAKFNAAGNAQMLYEGYLKPSVLALTGDLPEKDIDYQHIEYVGAGTVSLSSVTFGEVFRSSYGGLFTKGFDDSAIPADWARDRLLDYGIRPALRDAQKFQVNAPGKEEIAKFAEDLGKPELVEDLKRLNDVGLMTAEEVVQDLASLEPTVVEVARRWDESAAKSLTLTSVGIAIGHAYWRRVTGQDAPLSIWL